MTDEDIYFLVDWKKAKKLVHFKNYTSVHYNNESFESG